MVFIILSIITLETKSASRGRSKMRKYNSPRIIHYTSSKRKDYYDHPDGANILKASHFDYEYFLGHKIKLICVAKGDPVPRITWFKDGVEIISHPFMQVSEWHFGKNQIKSKLEIDPARQMDSGTYMCQANNKYAIDTRHFKADF
uniref:Ig-like domain-containing protein n=1 Tax=Tetranychus urticae TaxID=32264 RepID=T1KEZ2_TETUR